MQKQKIEEGNTVESEKAFVFALSVSHEIDAWYIDFGTSMHLSSCGEWLRDYENIVPIKIYMGNNSIQEAIGKGNLDVTMEIGESIVERTFIDVLHISRIAKYLFFVIKATSQGHTFEFQNNSCTLKNKDNHVVGKGIRENWFYKLQCTTTSSIIVVETTQVAHFAGKQVNNMNLWHLRFGHLGVEDLKLLAQKNLVDGLSLEA